MTDLKNISVISDPDIWRTDISAAYFGQCHTLEYNVAVGSHLDTHLIMLGLNSSLTYDIFIHDTRYYLTTLSPAAFPHIRLKRKSSNKTRNFDLLYLTQTRHFKLNREDHQCEDDEDYNFRDCVKNSVIRSAGCRMQWDYKSDERLCSSNEEIRKYEEEFLFLSQVEEREVLERTQCLPPCLYSEFTMVQYTEEFFFEFGLGIAYASTEVSPTAGN